MTKRQPMATWRKLGGLSGLVGISLIFASCSDDTAPGGSGTTGGRSNTGGSMATGGNWGAAGTNSGGTAGWNATGGFTGEAGRGGSASIVTVEPSQPVFPSTNVNPAAPPTATLSIYNRSALYVNELGFTIDGKDAADFRIQSNNCTANLNPNANCALVLAFAPSTPGSKTAQLNLKSNPGGTSSILLRANAVGGLGLSLTPSLQDFGQVTLNTESAAVDFELTNDSDVQTSTLATSLDGADRAHFMLGSSNCPASLQPKAKCKITVRFKPTTEGAKSAALVSTESGTTNKAQAVLSGSGKSASDLSITPKDKDFGEVTVGLQATAVFTVKNNGASKTGAVSLTTLGDSAGEFLITDNGCRDVLLEPQQSCDALVAVKPISAGDKTVFLRAGASPGGQVSATLSVKAKAAGNLLAFDPANYAFSKTLVGSSSSFTFLLKNTGNVVSGVPDISISQSSPNYKVTPSAACAKPIPAQGFCSVDVTFSPTQAQDNIQGLLRAIASPGGQASANLTGSGQDALAFTETDWDFGKVKINDPNNKPTHDFRLKNNGTVKTGAFSVNFNNAGTSAFSILQTDCGTQSTLKALDPGTFCTVTVQYAPTVSDITGQAKIGYLSASASPGGNANVTFKGEATRPTTLTVSPARYTFEPLQRNGTTASTAFIVRNDTEVSSGTITRSLLNGASSGFSITSGCNNVVLASGNSCTIQVQFGGFYSGSATGPRQDTLQVSTGSTTIQATLNGEVL